MAKKKNVNEMSFLHHLEDLRWLLVRSSVAIILMAFVTYFFSGFIFDNIIFGPTDPNFITYRFFCELAQTIGITGDICVKELPFIIQNTSMEGQINTFIWTCITAGFILAFPYILYELWKFISPALYEKEKKNALGFIVISSLLFFLGVIFGYFIIVPLSINFVATFSVSSVVKNEFNLDSYIGMIKTSVIAAGLFFELPVIIYFLTKLGLVGPNFLRKYRKYAILILLIIAAIVTPPDVVSQITVAIPMLLIYEASIWISVFVENKKMKDEQIS
ncbi:twin-arginine translocase subunit TatC [Flavobacterium sp.]|jgi:sec-independent protein translocase protein TatC|uniref:twin-arginine translocase subunit TatC n=1 Tax=Flavobacterium sp. TaxID=239 RepID=UPI0037C04077